MVLLELDLFSVEKEERASSSFHNLLCLRRFYGSRGLWSRFSQHSVVFLLDFVRKRAIGQSEMPTGQPHFCQLELISEIVLQGELLTLTLCSLVGLVPRTPREFELVLEVVKGIRRSGRFGPKDFGHLLLCFFFHLQLRLRLR